MILRTDGVRAPAKVCRNQAWRKLCSVSMQRRLDLIDAVIAFGAK
jgi:hypothetical protein